MKMNGLTTHVEPEALASGFWRPLHGSLRLGGEGHPFINTFSPLVIPRSGRPRARPGRPVAAAGLPNKTGMYKKTNG